ncbi:hypothetical protein N0V82_010591 [Gnomoniopsis sp. IMI 355080]|nr:hypothetical protein N0V82_010591 [Gnomoniopsis sp. IMI 355080]
MRFNTALLLPLAVSATPLTTSSTGPDPSQITIAQTSFSGNGCPQGTVSTSYSTDKTLVTFGFDSFQTYIGPGTTVADHSKNCQLHLTLNYPGGFQYSLVDSTYHGYAQMDTGVTGTFYSTYYFSQDASATATTTAVLTGGGLLAAGQVYTKEDILPTASIIWSPCGAQGILNINNRVALTSANTSASGQVTDDDATVAFTQQMHLQWQPCTKK